MIDEGDDASYEIDTLWYSQGRLTRDGFVVLIAIPFKSVRFSSAPVQEWRIALGRTISRRGESSFWPHISAHGRGLVRQMGALRGSALALWRVLRCSPLSAGGVDYAPTSPRYDSVIQPQSGPPRRVPHGEGAGA